MSELLQTVNGLDLIFLAIGGGVMAVIYEGVLRQVKRRHDQLVDRAYDEGWMDGCRTGRSIDRAIGSIMEEAEAHDE